MDQDEDFQEGDCEFTFPNGDRYEGHYCAHVSGLAWRQGLGTYYTHDGHVYEGIWKDDKLDESQNLEITFKDNTKYIGMISKYKYNGPGTYWFNNNARMSSIFQANKPIGEVIFIDHHDRMWHGVAENEHVLLKREHVFSCELDSERGKGVPLKPPLIEEICENIEPEEIPGEIDMKELEKEIFTKSSKLPTEIDFKDSEWIKGFEKYSALYKKILEKVKRSGARNLPDDEKELYKKYVNSQKILEDRKKKTFKKTDYHILKDYLTEKLKNTCPPTSVFYPTQIAEQEEQVEQ